MRSLIANCPSGKALDAACGTGRHAAYMASLGHRVTGIDVSGRMLEMARSKVPSAWFETADLASIPLENGSVDLAVCSLALTHCTDLGPPVKELGRVLRPGGTLIISDVHPFVVMLGVHAKYPRNRTETGYVRNYFHLPSEYISAFKDSVMDVVRCLKPLHGDEEIDVMGFDEQMTDLMKAALMGVPIIIAWELVKNS